jgi:hypothetical protein
MADIITPNYSFTIPEIGASDNTWGMKLNANWSSVDSVLIDMASDIDGKVDDSQVLTNVPENALFTDTIYSKPTSEPIGYIEDLQTSLDTLETKFNLAEQLAIIGL